MPAATLPAETLAAGEGGAWEAAGQGPAPAPRPSSNPWANIPRNATPAPQFGDLLPPPPSPVLRPAPTGEIYRSGSAVDVVPAERPVAALLDEPQPLPAAAGASPWDGDAGPATTLDLDAKPIPRTSTPAPGPANALPPATPAATAAAAAVDELDALMTGARELFALGDFSGSLDLVEKVLQREPAHEGARAYLKRNETTLLKMYESKLGQLGSVPSQLVPPDEVIWLNMHHRAGFILSQVDGMLSYEDLLDVSGMDRFDTVRILADLVQNGIIGVK
jgi:hypothetical protein